MLNLYWKTGGQTRSLIEKPFWVGLTVRAFTVPRQRFSMNTWWE